MKITINELKQLIRKETKKMITEAQNEKEIIEDLKNLSKGEIYQIKTPKTKYYVGRTYDNPDGWVLTSYLNSDMLVNHHYRPTSLYLNFDNMIQKLKDWIKK